MQTYSFAELTQFKTKPTHNPVTKRKIKNGSKIYNNLQRQLVIMQAMDQSALFVQQLYRYRHYRSIQKTFTTHNCINSQDPISLESIDCIPSSCLCCIPIKDVLFGYHIESIAKLLDNGTIQCPMTRVPIDPNTLCKMHTLVKSYKALMTPDCSHESIITVVEAMAKDVFHEFTLESIYLDHTVFLNLKMWQLKNLHYEWMDMFAKNTTPEQKHRVLGNGIVFQPFDFNLASKAQYQHYLLQQVIKILRPIDASMKTLVTFIMLGGLTLVCPQYSHYRMYAFEF